MACVETCVGKFASNTTVCREFCYNVLEGSCLSLPHILLVSAVIVACVFICVVGSTPRRPRSRLERPPMYGSVITPTAMVAAPDVYKPESSENRNDPST